LLEALGDGIAMRTSKGDDFQNEEVEGALWEADLTGMDTSSFYTYRI
jgi:hypothetical protein